MILRDVHQLNLALTPALARRYLLCEAALLAWRELTPGKEADHFPLVLEMRQPRRIYLRQRTRSYDLTVELRMEAAAAGQTRLRQEAWLEIDGRRLRLLTPLLWRALQRSARAALLPAQRAAVDFSRQGRLANQVPSATAIA